MNFLANENFPLKSSQLLEANGHNVVLTAKQYQGANDEFVLQSAIDNNQIILTFDADYGKLVFKTGIKPPSGIIYFRLYDFKPEFPAQMLLSLIENSAIKFENTLTVIELNTIRQRPY